MKSETPRQTSIGESAAIGQLTGTLLFHLNLAYSSIEAEDRAEVVRRCYRPILALAEERDWLKLAVEAPAHTLEQIAELDPEWLDRLRLLVAAGRVEFVGSGDTQLIGPLTPAAVHGWNQHLGRGAYEELLGRGPRVALVNEMAWSQGLVDGYLDAGYDHVCTEWNNPRRNHPEWDDEWRYAPAWTLGPDGQHPSGAGPGEGRRIGLLWTDAIAFQKFQRAVADELGLEEYLEWVDGRRDPESARPRHLFVYAGDAEIFDWRPGRFATEPPPVTNGPSEWERMAGLLAGLRERGVEFRLPSEVADTASDERPTVQLTSAADPIPVKKQPKYNVTRWALSGRDDLGLNTRCFARAGELAAAGNQSSEDWRELCRAWSSDLRTHLTETRWSSLALPAAPSVRALEVSRSRYLEPEWERVGRELRIRTDGLELVLDCRRGLAIRSLSTTAWGGCTQARTLPHGYFDEIDFSADFYSGHTIAEIPGSPRVTDLSPVEPRVEVEDQRVVVRAEVPTALGPLPQRIEVGGEDVVLHYGFSAWGERPLGSVRTGITTLDPDEFDGPLTAVHAAGGGPECLTVEGDFDHGVGVSPIVSARAGFGATAGRLELVGAEAGVVFEWAPEACAVVPLLANRRVGGRRWCRVAFSLSEVDETHRPGAPLLDFSVRLTPVLTPEGREARKARAASGGTP